MIETSCYPCLPTDAHLCVLDASWTPAARPARPVLPASSLPVSACSADAADMLAAVPFKLEVHLQECQSCALLVSEARAGNLYTTDVLLSVCVHLSRLTDLEDGLTKKIIRFADIVNTVSSSLGWPLTILPDAYGLPVPPSSAPGCCWFEVALWRTWPPLHGGPDPHTCVEAHVEAVSAFTAIEYLMRYQWWWSVPRATARALTGPRSLSYQARWLRVRLFDLDDEREVSR